VESWSESKQRTRSIEVEVAATERLLGIAYAENADLRREVEALHAALDRRDLVERAKGVIMGRLDVDADEAWELQHAGAKLRTPTVEPW
jgi:AmiR/NasT family two-component response regulator